MALSADIYTCDVFSFMFNCYLDKTWAAHFNALFADDLHGSAGGHSLMAHKITSQRPMCSACGRVFSDPHSGSKHAAMYGWACSFNFLCEREEVGSFKVSQDVFPHIPAKSYGSHRSQAFDRHKEECFCFRENQPYNTSFDTCRPAWLSGILRVVLKKRSTHVKKETS